MIFTHDPDVGRVFLPPVLTRMISFPNQPVRRAITGEVGIFFAKQLRPIFGKNGVLLRYKPVWMSITHNERVDAGAAYQAQQCFAGGGTPAVPSATVYFNAIAVATAGFTTKTKTDLSIGSASTGVTTNEFTTVGLSRVTATGPIGGDYTLPASLGATFSQVVKKTFTASGGATAHGAALFNSTTVSGSILYVEDQFSSDAVLVNLDTLAVTITISN